MQDNWQTPENQTNIGTVQIMNDDEILVHGHTVFAVDEYILAVMSGYCKVISDENIDLYH